MYFKCFKLLISLDNNPPFIPHPHIMEKVLTQGAGIWPNFFLGGIGWCNFYAKKLLNYAFFSKKSRQRDREIGQQF